MGKHDSDEAQGFFLGGANLVKNIVIGIKNNIKVIGIIALIPIVGVGAYFGVNYYKNNKDNSNKIVPVVAATPNNDEKEYLGGYEVIGNVEIKNLGMDVKILNPELDGTDYTEDALKYGAVLYYGEEINEIGNCTIIAHNDASNFFNLKNIEIDNELTVTNSDGLEVTYTVIEKKSVEPDDVSVVLPMEENSREITLITCDDEATTRLVVKAIAK